MNNIGGMILPFGVGAKFGSTWNPANLPGGGITLSPGNLANNAGNIAVGQLLSTSSKSSGNWYFEVTFTAGNNSGRPSIGLATSSITQSTVFGYDANGLGYESDGGNCYMVSTAQSPQYQLVNSGRTSVGQTIGVAVNLGSRTIAIYNNGVLQGSGLSLCITGAVYAAAAGVAGYNTTVFTINFGNSPFYSGLPSGYTAWG